MAKHIVKCAVCQKQFDTNEIQSVKFSARRYAHQKCFPEGVIVPMEKSAEDPDLKILKDYINKVLGDNANWALIQKQIKKYHSDEFNYSYSGMLKTLQFCYEKEHADPAAGHGGIGVVELNYDKVQKYYYSLYLSRIANQDVDAVAATSKEKEIIIKEPKRKIFWYKLFKMEDE